MSKTGRILKIISNELIYNNHLSALVGIFLVLIASIVTNMKVSPVFLIVLYLIFYIIYSYNRYKELKLDIISNPKRTEYLKTRISRTKKINLTYFFLLIILLLYNFESSFFLFGISLLILGLLYTTHFKKLTRKIVAFKSIYVAAIWTSTILFYAFYHSILWNNAFTIISLFIFLRLLIGINFFDIKDMESDKKENLKTLPVLLGKRKIKIFLALLNLISAIPILLGIYFKFIPFYALSLLISIPYTYLYLKEIRTPRINRDLLYYVIVNIESAAWLLSLLIVKLIFMKFYV